MIGMIGNVDENEEDTEGERREEGEGEGRGEEEGRDEKEGVVEEGEGTEEEEGTEDANTFSLVVTHVESSSTKSFIDCNFNNALLPCCVFTTLSFISSISVSDIFST